MRTQKKTVETLAQDSATPAGAVQMAADSAERFENMCHSAHVPEWVFQELGNRGITSCNAFCFQVNSQRLLEQMLEEILFGALGWAWEISPSAGSVRRVWWEAWTIAVPAHAGPAGQAAVNNLHQPDQAPRLLPEVIREQREVGSY